MTAGAEPRARDGTLDALALALTRGVGSVRYRELRARHGGPGNALRAAANPADRDRALGLAQRAWERMGALRGDTLLLDEAGYPEALLDLADPPPALFAIGDLALLARPLAAVVGTRAATRYGERVTRELAGALARAGVGVVSGMARGIDAAAHRAALAENGATIAVLGTGVDVPYPAAHAALHREIAERGLLLSELPPGMRGDAGSFPRRNRIIAALGRVTLVVEAGHRSGALITAACALDLDRSVAAVPGPIDAAESAGCNLLIRDGAQVITDVADLLQLAGATPAGAKAAPALCGAEAVVWNALCGGTADLDSLIARSRLPARDCITALGALEVAGLVECALTGEIRRR